MEESKKNILIDHLDQSLQGEKLPEAEALLQQSAEAREEWEYLQLATEAIRHEALSEQVAAVKAAYLADKNKKPVIQLKKLLKAAAIILLIPGAIALYKYYSVTATGFFHKQYALYELPVSRGNTDSTNTAIVKAYQQQEWKQVISLSEKTTERNNQVLFLAGIAYLQLQQPQKASQLFEKVLSANDQYYHDEATYYFALSLLAANDAARALPLLEKIAADPQHLYHEKVRGMSGLDWKILRYKTGASQ